ncbi:DUF1932 domain-containing protein [Yoonia sp.]|uniref:NAD(P)-dependent oxidoreductase n=1 Tax=Yoonia sp. TaxID=2212373 RepID=UPI00391BFC80
MTSSNIHNALAFIGFGEAATAFLSGWDKSQLMTVCAFDIKSNHPDSAAAIQDRMTAHGVTGAATARQAVGGAQKVFSVVTADQALVAAEAAAPGIAQGVLWFDCNSCSPGTKRAASDVIQKAGGRYVDVAVMAPVYPKQHHVPLLISGPHAHAAEQALLALDMKPQIVGDRIGQASSIKMLRSVMIKGMEALTAECFLAARQAGVEDAVIGSLEASDPDIQWRKRGSYNLERMMVHGARRAAEMEEVALTVQELGLGGRMSAAAAQWQALVAAIAADPGKDDLYARADVILSRLITDHPPGR